VEVQLHALIISAIGGGEILVSSTRGWEVTALAVGVDIAWAAEPT
jgi:hypothetical protein